MSRQSLMTITISFIIVCTVSKIQTYDVVVENITEPWVDPLPKKIKEEMFKKAFEPQNTKVRKTVVNNNDTENDNVTVSKNNFANCSNKNTENKTKAEVNIKYGPPDPVQEPPRMINKPFDGIGPGGYDDDEATTCDEFSSNARFNPYSVLDDKWYGFYYWSGDNSPILLRFIKPSAKTLQTLHELLDPQVLHPIDWNARHVLVEDVLLNVTTFLVERGDRGQYWAYPCGRNFPVKIVPKDFRLKQTGDNKYIGLMVCEYGKVYVLARPKDIPPKKIILDEASKIGYKGRKGRSYLYQGHHWMPIPEIDELEYWAPMHYRKDNVDVPPAPHEDDDDVEDPISSFAERFVRG